jgi:type II secretory pathway pseudopilin PulG
MSVPQNSILPPLKFPLLSSPGKGTQAFTVLDLLACLLMIALLALVMMPALAKSGDNGRRTICTNNLRQLGAASTLYANENQDYFAYPNWGTVSPGWLYALSNGQVPNPSQAGAYSNGLWFQYVQNAKSYLCPVDLESKFYAQRLNRLSSYVMNGAPCGFGVRTSTFKVTDVWNPACYLLWAPDENAVGPGIPGAFDYNDGANFPSSNEGLDRLHTANGSELLTVAGNVQFVSGQKWKTESGNLGRSLTWWSAFSGNGH